MRNVWVALTKKLKRRKQVLLLVGIAFVLFCLAAVSLSNAIHHRGPGWITIGGAQPGTDGWIEEDQETVKVDQKAYRKDATMRAAILMLAALAFAWEAIRRYARATELEASWIKTVSVPANLVEIRNNPQNYRDDFLEWVKDTL